MSVISINNLYSVIEEFVDEKGISKETIIQGITEALQQLYTIKLPDCIIVVEFNKKKGEIVIQKLVTVVAKVENEKTEILLKKALAFNETAQIGEEIKAPCDVKLNRVDIIKIKQIMNSKIKAIEIQLISKEFEAKKNTIVTGVVNKIDHYGVSLLVQGYNAFLPKSNQIPEEKYHANMNLKVLVKEIAEEPRNLEEIIILDRSSNLFIEKLLELEIPEIFEGVVKIEKVARVPGYKTKVLVYAKDKNVNPVGTCIGVAGARIKPILKEIEPERIDFIAATENKEQLVIDSLKPAKINFVSFQDDKAFVSIDQDERPVAIGKNGKNIHLASEISGFAIELIENKNNAYNPFLDEN